MDNNNENLNDFKLIDSTYPVCTLLIHKNYIFQKNYANQDQSINWRCQNNRLKGELKCPVTCRTKGEIFIRPPHNKHNHPPEKEAKIKMHQVVQDVKANVVNQRQGIKRYFEETVSENIAKSNLPIEEYIDYLPKYKDYEAHLFKLKHEQIPKLPKTIQDIDLSSEKYNSTKDARRFLLAQTSNDKIIFSSNYQLEILSSAVRWHILEKIRDFLQFMYKSLFQCDFNLNLNLIHARSLPLQKNHYDCGVYVCKIAEFICKKRDFTFSDQDMIRYRRKIVLSVLRNKVL
jgi:hypothetical protein